MTKAEKFNQLTCTEFVRGNLRTSSVRAAAFTGAASFADFALRIGSTAILARLILPEHFGLVMMVTAVTAIADQLRDLGLSTATVQRKEINHQEVTNLFWLNASAGVFICLLICALSPLLSIYYKEPRLTVITCVLASNFIWGGLMAQHQALLARVLKLGTTAIVRVSASVISTILALFLAWKGFGFWALVWKEVLRCFLLTVGMWICFPWVPGFPSRKTNIRELIRFGMHVSGANILGTISSGADRFVIGRFLGATPVAMYRQAYQLIVTMIDQLLGPIYQVTQPGLSMLQSEPERFRRYFQKVLTVIAMWIMPLNAFVAVYCTEITRIFLGRNWDDAAPILLILSIGAFIKQPVGFSSIILVTRGKSKPYFYIALVHHTMLVLFICFGVRWGIKGVAIADVLTTYLMVLPKLYICLKGSPVTIRVFVSAIARPAIASLTMVILLLYLRWLLMETTISVRLGCGVVAAPIVFFATWILTPGGKAQLFFLSQDIRAALQRKGIRVPKLPAMPAVVD